MIYILSIKKCKKWQQDLQELIFDLYYIPVGFPKKGLVFFTTNLRKKIPDPSKTKSRCELVLINKAKKSQIIKKHCKQKRATVM